MIFSPTFSGGKYVFLESQETIYFLTQNILQFVRCARACIICYMCVLSSASYEVVGIPHSVTPLGLMHVLTYLYLFLFPYPGMLLLPMSVPAAQSWPVRGKAARLSSVTTASKYGIQIRHAIWPVSRGRRHCEFGPSTLQVSVMGKNLGQVWVGIVSFVSLLIFHNVSPKLGEITLLKD